MPTDAQLLASSVARLNRRLRQERQSELTATQLSVLSTIRKLGAATPSTIAAHERVRPPSITRTLTGLVDGGYAIKTPDPDDGRQMRISIAELGETTLANERSRRDHWLAQYVVELAAEDRAALRRAAELMQELAEK